MLATFDASSYRCKLDQDLDWWGCAGWWIDSNPENSKHADRILWWKEFEQATSPRWSCRLWRDYLSWHPFGSRHGSGSRYPSFGCNTPLDWNWRVEERYHVYECDHSSQHGDTHWKDGALQHRRWWSDSHQSWDPPGRKGTSQLKPQDWWDYDR